METPWFSLLSRRCNEPLTKLGVAEFLALVRPKCKQIVRAEELENLIRKKKKLTVKLGADPTGVLHLGHALPLVLLRIFQRRGHEIHFIVGDFTAAIGDPAGRIDKRSELGRADIVRNMKNYTRDAGRIIDIKKAVTHYNSEWLSRMKLADFFRVLGAVSFGEVAQREDFRMRMKSGVGVSMKEANYSALMALDSLEINADIEIGAIDQLLNFMHTRDIMKALGRAPETLLMTPLLEGTAGDGRKMSKSFNNFIALADAPEKQFGLIMSIPDKLTLSYFISFGDIYENEIEDLDRSIHQNPLQAKKDLGMLVVSILHGDAEAEKARENFERKFSKKEVSSKDAEEIGVLEASDVSNSLVIAFRSTQSKSRIRALIEQGAVKRISPNAKTLGLADMVSPGDLIKVGKLKLFYFKKK